MKIFDVVYEELKKACHSIEPPKESDNKIITETYFTIIATKVLVT